MPGRWEVGLGELDVDVVFWHGNEFGVEMGFGWLGLRLIVGSRMEGKVSAGECLALRLNRGRQEEGCFGLRSDWRWVLRMQGWIAGKRATFGWIDLTSPDRMPCPPSVVSPLVQGA